jgi:hypothetical protein
MIILRIFVDQNHLFVGGDNNRLISFFPGSFLRNTGRKLEKEKLDKMICRRCFNLSLICVFWLSANALAFCRSSSDPPPLSKNNPDGVKRMKILVADQSKYGGTKQYAAWIQQDIKGDLIIHRASASFICQKIALGLQQGSTTQVAQK